MQALKKDKNSIYKLINEHYEQLQDLIVEIEDQTKRVTLIKTLIYLILIAPEELSNLNQKFFGTNLVSVYLPQNHIKIVHEQDCRHIKVIFGPY